MANQNQQPKYTPLQGPSDITNPGNINATAPAPYQQFGNIPQLSPTYYSAVNANPFQQEQYLKQYNQMYTKGLQPFFNQQLMAQNQNEAARGIQDSSAAGYLTGQLQGQQAGQVAQGEAPMVQQAFGQTQQDILANQAAQNSARQYGATAANEAAGTNAQYYNQAVTGNQAAYNSYMQQLYGTGSNEQDQLLSAYLNSFGPQTGVESAFGNELGGLGSTYGDIYGSMLTGGGQAMGGLFSGLGAAAAGGAF